MKSERYGRESEIEETFLLEGKRHRVVSKRWGISLLVCLITLLDVFGYANFSFVNDITSSYYGIQPAVTDLQAIANRVGIVTGVLVICAIGGWLVLQQMTVLACIFLGSGSSLIAIGVVSKIFGLLVAGMFLSGCAGGIMMSIGQLVTVNWFPVNERGKATALSLASRILAALLSNVVATRAMGISYSHQELEQMKIHPEIAEDVDKRFKIVFASIFGSISLSSVVCLILTIIFISDKPPIYESEEQLVDPVSESTPFFRTPSSYSIISEMRDVGILFRNKSFTIFFVLYAFAMTDKTYGDTLISSLVLKEFPQSNDQFVGLMFIFGIIIAAFSGPLVGQILDKSSKPRLTTVFVTSLLILAFVASAISFHIHSIVGVFASYLAVASSRYPLLVCLKHRGSGITANQSRSVRFKAYGILTAGGMTFISISTIFVRFLMDRLNSSVGVLFPVPFLVCLVLSLLFLWAYLRDVKQI